MAHGNTVRDGSGSSFWHLIDALGRLRIYDDWTPELQSDIAANDSDKTFTVPADTQWRVKWIWVEYTSDGNAGARQLAIEIQDDTADVIAQMSVGITQAASLTYNYLLAPNVTELAALRDATYLTTIMPEWILPEAHVVRVWDNNAVSAAGDDVIIHMMVETRPMPA